MLDQDRQGWRCLLEWFSHTFWKWFHRTFQGRLQLIQYEVSFSFLSQSNFAVHCLGVEYMVCLQYVYLPINGILLNIELSSARHLDLNSNYCRSIFNILSLNTGCMRDTLTECVEIMLYLKCWRWVTYITVCKWTFLLLEDLQSLLLAEFISVWVGILSDPSHH